MENQTGGYGYGKRPLWQWILLYIVVGGIVYGLIYYFVFGRNGGYGYGGSPETNSSAQPSAPSPTSDANPTPATTPPAASNPAPAVLNVLGVSSNASLGSYIVSTNGRTLYKSSNDSAGVSNCTAGCASFWPPYTVSASQSASLGGAAAATGKIGTLKRADGSLQVTYNGSPLYFFAQDAKAGDATGNNVNGFMVVKP